MHYIIRKFASGMHYIEIPAAVVTRLKGEKRALCTLGDLQFHTALMHLKDGRYYVNIGSSVLKKLKLKEGMKVSPKFSKDETAYQFSMPETFEEVLRTDVEASGIFHSLTSGTQRSLIYLVQQVKSPDKQIERALLITSRLKDGITSPRVILKK